MVVTVIAVAIHRVFIYRQNNSYILAGINSYSIRPEKRKGEDFGNRLMFDQGISTKAVEKHLSKLKSDGIIFRIGPDKGDHWEVR